MSSISSYKSTENQFLFLTLLDPKKSSRRSKNRNYSCIQLQLGPSLYIYGTRCIISPKGEERLTIYAYLGHKSVSAKLILVRCSLKVQCPVIDATTLRVWHLL